MDNKKQKNALNGNEKIAAWVRDRGYSLVSGYKNESYTIYHIFDILFDEIKKGEHLK